jgi:hypothetical protein
MRVSDKLLKSVAFVSRDEETFDYRGTAFVVSVPFDEKSACLHLVTAKHVALALRNGEAALVMNAKDGQPRWMKNGMTEWFYHPTDPSVDVAVMPMATPRAVDYDYQDIPVDLFVTPERLVKYNIGIGDETVNVGMFKPFLGATRFTPMVRTGTLAMMPDGRVPHPVFGSIEADLVEGRSVGGQSGSPVFVRDTFFVRLHAPEGEPVQMSALGGFHLLGLMHGHWKSPSDGTEATNNDSNMGISLVVPAQKILEVLFSPELTAEREKAFKRGFIPPR